MLFDIHTNLAAQRTLYQLTGIPIEVWEDNMYHECDFENQDDFVEFMIKEYGTRQLPQSYKDLDFAFFHVTTSSDSCTSIKQNGILDLKKAYECDGSELRLFLDEHNVLIDLDRAILKYYEREYDIYYEKRPWDLESIEYKCWSVGSKFYNDYTICGFLSARDCSPYPGQIHRQPEILWDIDELLKTRFSYEWERTHSPYEVVSKVSGMNIRYPYYDDESEAEKVMTYVAMAYDEVFNASSENVLVLKNGVKIPPTDIISIAPLSIWR